MMIEVNLLPAEMRRMEHTPLPRFLVILLGTATIMATGAFGVVVNWRRVPDLEGKVAGVRADVRRCEKTAHKHDELVASIAETKDRKKAIAQLWHARIQWSRKWAQLAEITPKFVGLTDMKLTEARLKGKKEENGGFLTLKTIIAGGDLNRMSNLRRVLTGELACRGGDAEVGKAFFNSFMELLPGGAKKVEAEEYVEKVALETSVKMPLKSTEVRLDEAVETMLHEQREKKARKRAGSTTARGKPGPGAPGATETVTNTEAASVATANAVTTEAIGNTEVTE